MSWDAWGDPALAKPLSDSILGLLTATFGVEPGAGPRRELASVEVAQSRLTDEDLDALRAVAEVSTADADRILRSGGKSTLDLLRRRGSAQDAVDAVVAPADENAVAAVLALALARYLAVVPFGGGTSVVGGLDPIAGARRGVIALDLALLSGLESFDEASREATFLGGTTGPVAETALAERGFELGHYPQSFRYATIGGFAATRSSGQDSAGYGRFDAMVTGLRVITPTGAVDLGRAPGSAAGPDVVRMFLGSEGTLGVITAVRVKVHPIPLRREFAAWSFPDFAAGATFLRRLTQSGITPTVLRLSDEMETGLNLASGKAIGEAPPVQGCLAIATFEGGDPESVAITEFVGARAAAAAALAEELGGTDLGPGPAQAWDHGRFSAPYVRDALLDAGALCETLETATTWSNLATLKQAVSEAAIAGFAAVDSPALVLCHISHVYPTGASLYFTIVGAQRDEPIAQWQSIKRRISTAIVAAGGTITHHHAVGVDHAPWMRDEVGEIGVRMLRALKTELDPAGILNPGKLLP